ncbi:MAG: site-2 protease family protein [Candidatus Magasanikbacteria bacterium CG10_big_fil_rev_8_21_14_0_10_36_32]|uniref:Site-2 protease family protein n=1 Tax=Candidatus Magasanikbacteria bacterium CG10_big_fil_rev_8_21_14_0_10_36_32 TaxID=1974646 RepID=A0A2M6W648_9BACT|nr:MAG: site-2 protease family protein [Candidatus Magasanikbacteria bacterium CG10_big_fil_rev_8_21_14_0_10_36_32]
MNILFYFFIIIPSAIIHEYAHGWMADRLGDPTARYAGRLTLNPKAHIDLWGTILMPLLLSALSGGSFLFAYAKPVPYNPYNLKNQKWGPALVGLAGPMANFLLAAIFALIIRFINPTLVINELLFIIVYANVLLMVFNLVPIPPLDGSKILYAVLPDSMNNLKIFLERYSFILLMILIFFLFDFIAPIINTIVSWLI